MRRKGILASRLRWVGCALAFSALSPVSASAQTLSGQVVYRGLRGPVSPQRPIALLLFDDNDGLLEGIPRAATAVPVDGGQYSLSPGEAGLYFLLFTLAPGGVVQVGQPYQVFDNRGQPPFIALTVPTANLPLLLNDSYLMPGIAGRVAYSGSGTVSASRPLIVLFSRRADFDPVVARIAVTQNGGRYDLPRFDSGPYYVAAFYDADGDGEFDTGEPLRVFANRTQSPGDPVVPSATQQAIDLALVDVPPTATVPQDTPTPSRTPTTTATPTRTPTRTPTATSSPTATLSPSATATPTRRPPSTPGPCVGDCNGDGMISVAELIRGAAIALGTQRYEVCPSFDRNRNGTVQVGELVHGINGALDGCLPVAAADR